MLKNAILSADIKAAFSNSHAHLFAQRIKDVSIQILLKYLKPKVTCLPVCFIAQCHLVRRK